MENLHDSVNNGPMPMVSENPDSSAPGDYRPLTRQEIRSMTFHWAMTSGELTGTRKIRRQKARLASKMLHEQLRTKVSDNDGR